MEKEINLLKEMNKHLIAEVVAKLEENYSKKHYNSSEKDLKKDKEIILHKKNAYKCFLSIEDKERFKFHIYELDHDDYQLYEFFYEELKALVDSLKDDKQNKLFIKGDKNNLIDTK